MDSVAGTARQQLDAMIDETALGYGMGIGERDDDDTPDRGSLVWLAEEAYKLGAAGLRTQLEQARSRGCIHSTYKEGCFSCAARDRDAAFRKVTELRAELETAELALSSLQGALREYGQHHYHECMFYQIDGEWRHRGPITECLCGLAQLLNTPKFPADGAGIIGKVAFLDGPDSESSATTEHLREPK